MYTEQKENVAFAPYFLFADENFKLFALTPDGISLRRMCTRDETAHSNVDVTSEMLFETQFNSDLEFFRFENEDGSFEPKCAMIMTVWSKSTADAAAKDAENAALGECRSTYGAQLFHCTSTPLTDINVNAPFFNGKFHTLRRFETQRRAELASATTSSADVSLVPKATWRIPALQPVQTRLQHPKDNAVRPSVLGDLPTPCTQAWAKLGQRLWNASPEQKSGPEAIANVNLKALQEGVVGAPDVYNRLFRTGLVFTLPFRKSGHAYEQNRVSNNSFDQQFCEKVVLRKLHRRSNFL